MFLGETRQAVPWAELEALILPLFEARWRSSAVSTGDDAADALPLTMAGLSGAAMQVLYEIASMPQFGGLSLTRRQGAGRS